MNAGEHTGQNKDEYIHPNLNNDIWGLIQVNDTFYVCGPLLFLVGSSFGLIIVALYHTSPSWMMNNSSVQWVEPTIFDRGLRKE